MAETVPESDFNAKLLTAPADISAKGTLACKFFIVSAAIFLLLTAAAKLISSFGSDSVLEVYAPFFGMSFRSLFRLVATLEIAVAAFCLFGKKPLMKSATIVWLSSCFVFYRVGLILVHYKEPCGCLGSLTGQLGISTKVANQFVTILLVYLFAGGIAATYFLWKQNAKSPL